MVMWQFPPPPPLPIKKKHARETCLKKKPASSGTKKKNSWRARKKNHADKWAEKNSCTEKFSFPPLPLPVISNDPPLCKTFFKKIVGVRQVGYPFDAILGQQQTYALAPADQKRGWLVMLSALHVALFKYNFFHGWPSLINSSYCLSVEVSPWSEY